MKAKEGQDGNFEDVLPFDEGVNFTHQEDGKSLIDWRILGTIHVEYEIENGDLDVLESNIVDSNFEIVEKKAAAADDEIDAKIKDQMNDLLREDEDDAEGQDAADDEDDQEDADYDQEGKDFLSLTSKTGKKGKTTSTTTTTMRRINKLVSSIEVTLRTRRTKARTGKQVSSQILQNW